MKSIDKINANIENNKELQNNFKKLYSFTNEEFLRNANRYIKAIKQGRVICSIGSVSASGMSRTIKFMECNGNIKNGFNYLNFQALFIALGFGKAKNNYDYFKINGCGMDMIFHTNYTIIHSLYNLGLISKKECSSLAQKTPTTI